MLTGKLVSHHGNDIHRLERRNVIASDSSPKILSSPGNSHQVHTFNANLNHCVKSVYIWSFSGPYFPTFGLEKLRTWTFFTQWTSFIKRFFPNLVLVILVKPQSFFEATWLMHKPSSCLNFLRFQLLQLLKNSLYFYSRKEEVKHLESSKVKHLEFSRSVVFCMFY